MGRCSSRLTVAACLAAVLAVVAAPAPAPAADQPLVRTIREIFEGFLDIELSGPGVHGLHFRLSNVETSRAVQQAFVDLTAANVSSFPLSSTVSGLTFDFASGVPVASTTSLGPIFAERAQTLGRRRINIGANYSVLSFDEIRGVPTDKLRFSFTHQNVGGSQMGDNENEFDVLNMAMDLNVEAKVFAFYGTVGVTDRLDVGIALPIIDASIQGEATATFDSFTGAGPDTANHFYGQPENLSATRAFDNSASGIGDVALRAKYYFYAGRTAGAAVLADLRFPTGKEEDFLGAGDANLRAQAIFSWAFGDFSPHINAGFEHRGAPTDADEVEMILGFDQKLTEHLTFALEYFGEIEVEDPAQAVPFPGPITIQGNPDSTVLRTKIVLPTNIPNRDDNLSNGSFGIKWNPRERLLFLANAIIGLNHGGLRADVLPTIGVEYNF